MKERVVKILIVLLFVTMLFEPKSVFTGACEGLLLWFHTIFPTLFPFLLINNLLFYTDGIRYICKITSPFLHRFFRVSEDGSFAIAAGFLCGCPMGAKAAADLVAMGRITKEEGGYLLSFCNNISPVFIYNFILWKTLEKTQLALLTFITLFGIPVLMSFIFRIYYLNGQKYFPALNPSRKKEQMSSFELLDTCILNAFESITKVGGYIILFSVLIKVIQALPFALPIEKYILPCLEITNGINMIGSSSLPFPLKYQAILTLTSFGGLCAAAQTSSLVKGSGLSINTYMIEKLAAALATSLIALIFLDLS